MRLALIANPKAGRNRGLVAAQAAEAEFRQAGWEVTTKLTGAAGDATRLARSAALEGFEAVFACGGDGTLSEVVNGLLDTGVPAGIVPAGTGNDFARTIGLSREARLAAAQLAQGRAASIDLLEINGGELFGINVLGVGFDARVCQRINRRPRLLGGTTAYLLAVAQELLTYRPTEIKLRVDGEEWEGRALLVAVANAVSYGGGMKIAPQARIDDGLLDVVVVQHLSRLNFVRSFPQVMKGTHLAHPAVRAWQGREVEIATGEPSPVLVDGDLRAETPLRVRVAEGRGRLWRI